MTQRTVRGREEDLRRPVWCCIPRPNQTLLGLHIPTGLPTEIEVEFRSNGGSSASHQHFSSSLLSFDKQNRHYTLVVCPFFLAMATVIMQTMLRLLFLRPGLILLLSEALQLSCRQCRASELPLGRDAISRVPVPLKRSFRGRGPTRPWLLPVNLVSFSSPGSTRMLSRWGEDDGVIAGIRRRIWERLKILSSEELEALGR